MSLENLPEDPVKDGDLELYRSVSRINVPAEATIAIGNSPGLTDLTLIPLLEYRNFQKCLPGEIWGWRKSAELELFVTNEQGVDVSQNYFSYHGNEIHLKTSVTPSMLTVNERAIKLDCLGYFMERCTQADILR